MGQQGSRADDGEALGQAPPSLPSPNASGSSSHRPLLELKEATATPKNDRSDADERSPGQLPRPDSQSRSRHATPTPPSRQNPPKPAALPGVRPPSSQGSRGGMQGQGQLLLSKSGQLRRTATGGGLIGPESPNALHVPGAPGGLKTHNEESPPPTRPGTAASLASVQHAYRRDPQRYRVELPGQMPEIATPDPSPPATQPAALALRVRPGTGAHGHGQWRVLPTAKATNARPTSSGGDPALQPLSLSLTLKSGSSSRRTLTSAGGPRPETSEKAHQPPQLPLGGEGPGRRQIRWVEDIARFYKIGASVMPSCHSGMEIRHASRATLGEESPSTESFVVKLRYKNKSFQGKNEESRWRNTELILNMPQTNGVARLIDVVEDSRAYYVVMERAGGCDLYECLSGAPERRLPPHEAKEVLKELLTAVAELHAHGFIHKDLKLENVMLNKPGPKCPAHIRRNLATSPGAGVKLIDFDTVEEWNSTGPKSKHVLGTDQYIAPEAYEGKYSPASDIFAVGVIAYKILTGSFPYNGRLFDDKPGENWVGSPKMKEIRQKLCDARVSFSHAVFDKEPGAQRLVARMLAVSESDRPDAQECLRDAWLSEPSRPKSSQDSAQPVARAVLVHHVRGRAQPVQSQQRTMAHNAAIGNVQQLLHRSHAQGEAHPASRRGKRMASDDLPGTWAGSLA